MDFQPGIFAQAPIDSNQMSACSPQIADSEFRGVMIRVPDQVRIAAGETARVPVCGQYRLPTAPLMAGAAMYVVLRSTDGVLPHPLRARVIEGVSAQVAPNPAPPLPPSAYAYQVSQSCFNVDAQRYLPQPLPPGHYEIYMSYGDFHSNVARFVISR